MTYVHSVMYCCVHPVLKLANLILKYLQRKAQLDKIHPVPENHTGIGANVSDYYILKFRQGSSLL